MMGEQSRKSSLILTSQEREIEDVLDWNGMNDKRAIKQEFLGDLLVQSS